MVLRYLFMYFALVSELIYVFRIRYFSGAPPRYHRHFVRPPVAQQNGTSILPYDYVRRDAKTFCPRTTNPYV